MGAGERRGHADRGGDRDQELRIGAVRKRVYKERGSFAALGYRANVHDKVMRDSVRVMARITSLMRSRGVRVPHAGVYSESGRKKWIAGLPEAARYAAEILYAELDALMVLRAHAEKEMVSEARRHAEFRILKSCPGLGSIRAAQLMAVVVRPQVTYADGPAAASPRKVPSYKTDPLRPPVYQFGYPYQNLSLTIGASQQSSVVSRFGSRHSLQANRRIIGTMKRGHFNFFSVIF